MGDSWEDEEFDVPTLAATSIPNHWDEEDEVVVEPVVVPTKPSAAQLAAAAKSADEAEKNLASKVKLASLKNETPAERKARIKQEEEQSNNELAGDLFNTTIDKSSSSARASKGLGAISLKTKQDHINFGNTITQKLSDSSAFNVGAFYKALSAVLETPAITSEVVDGILSDIQVIAKEKSAAAQKSTKKQSKKAIKAAQQKHKDVFGAAEENDEYDDRYGGLEDDYMF